MLSCYNRGCGKDYDPENNPDDACRFHPGLPFFHDAHKGWSCCKRRSIDFTEFLNIKGCELSKHSNVKPPEPEKPARTIIEEETPKKVHEPIKPSALKRPSFECELTTLKPTIAPALIQSIDDLVIGKTKNETKNGFEGIPIGTICKNNGCGHRYESPTSDNSDCVHHPGVPIFHEGLKYWSCCKKRTTDFIAFTNQKGCANGKHKWLQDVDAHEEVKCRYDWHQTGSNVVIAIYAKMYHYEKSSIKLSPVRLNVCLVFPQQGNAEFKLDIELRGIIDVRKATAQMLGTKVEITLPKAEPGTWTTLYIPKKTVEAAPTIEEPKPDTDAANESSDSDLDLNDIEQVRGVKITNA